MPSLSKKNMKTLHSGKFNLTRIAEKPYIRRRSLQLKRRVHQMSNKLNSTKDPLDRRLLTGRLNLLQGQLKSFDKTGNAYIHNPASYLKMDPKRRSAFQKGMNKYAGKQPRAVQKAYTARLARTVVNNPRLKRSARNLSVKNNKKLSKQYSLGNQFKNAGKALGNIGHAAMYHSLAHNASQVGHNIGKGAKNVAGAGKIAGRETMQIPHVLANSPKVFKQMREQRLDHQMSSPKYYEQANKTQGVPYNDPRAKRMLKHQYIHHVKRNASHYNIPSKHMSLNGRKYTVPNFAKATLKSPKQLMNQKLAKDSHLSKKYQIHDYKLPKHAKAHKAVAHHKSIGKATSKSAMPKSFHTHLSKQGVEEGDQLTPEENDGPELD